jgi:hypothetical protein
MSNVSKYAETVFANNGSVSLAATEINNCGHTD